MSFEQLKVEVQKGIEGRNGGIPMGFDRLNRYIGIRKSIYTLVGGLTGSGKTSFIDDCYVLNPFDFITSKANTQNLKLRVIYRSMERNRVFKYAKWVSRKIFIDQGVIIPVPKLLGWTGRMTKDEHDLFLMYEEYGEKLKEIITIIDGPENPIGIAKDIKAHAEKYGKIERLDEYNKIYIPDDPDVITIIVLDHVGLIKTTKELTTKKQTIDKMSSELRYARDLFGYSPVVVSQFNRDIANPMRIKNGDVEPNLEDFKDSANTQEDADVVLALFDPMRYKVEDPSGYDLEKLKDAEGAKFFRSLRVIKNSFGSDDLRIGMGFFGEIGMFKELKRKKDMTDSDYESVTNKQFFLR